MSIQHPIRYLERKLELKGHRIWGFVLYRCTYASDLDWDRFMNKLKAEYFRQLVYWGAELAEEWPVSHQIAWTVVEDRQRLDHASKYEVRRTFQEWCRSAAAAAEQPDARIPVEQSRMARYRYCLQVDEASVRAVLDESPYAHVNVIDRDWVPEDEEDQNDEVDEDEVPEEGDWYLLHEPERFSPVEGCSEEDVGWCRVTINSAVLSAYVELCGDNVWYPDRFYQRPPSIVGGQR